MEAYTKYKDLQKKKRKNKQNKETKKKQELLHFWLSRTLSTCDTVEGMSMTELSMNKSAASLDIYSLTNLSKWELRV